VNPSTAGPTRSAGQDNGVSSSMPADGYPLVLAETSPDAVRLGSGERVVPAPLDDRALRANELRSRDPVASGPSAFGGRMEERRRVHLPASSLQLPSQLSATGLGSPQLSVITTTLRPQRDRPIAAIATVLRQAASRARRAGRPDG
jgi:hypothetical protein